MSARPQKAFTGNEPFGALETFKAMYGAKYEEKLYECERRLAEVAARPSDKLALACTMTLAAGGKRLRPLLVFLFSKKGCHFGEEHYSAAVAVEMVHMATLVHDDVLDAADLRRGKPTVMARFGAEVSTAAGDYLFSAAFDILTGAKSPRAVSALARTSLDLSRGELLQMEAVGDTGLSWEDYKKRCLLKTSSLFSTACKLGVMLSGIDGDAIEAAGEYGNCLGLAFQISDDILDYSADTRQTGKRLGTDLRDGTVTLPLIMALERDPELAGLISGGLDEERLFEVCERVRRSGGLEAARQRALEFVDEAGKALDKVDAVIDTEPLKLIAAVTVDRSG